MSTELETNVTHNNESITNTSFSAGGKKGQCLQMTQVSMGADSLNFNNVKLTKEQVVQQVEIMLDWLGQ